MKRVISFVLFILFALFICGCDLRGAKEFITFESVSSPYLIEYGTPNRTNHFVRGDYESIKWWYYSIGFNITFVLSPYDNIYGWAVGSTYTSSRSIK